MTGSPGGVPFETTVRWFGPDDRPLLGWLTSRPGSIGRHAVLLLPPIGYETAPVPPQPE